MAFKDLREFVSALDKAGELLRVKEEVDPRLEITDLLDRAVKEGGPALLFEKVKGSAVPLLGNALGTNRRMLMALGLESYDEIDRRI
ncbi:MAG: menaquinone biosynthesis decarboxylase, partial [Acidobacteriota bacterium]